MKGDEKKNKRTNASKVPTTWGPKVHAKGRKNWRKTKNKRKIGFLKQQLPLSAQHFERRVRVPIYDFTVFPHTTQPTQDSWFAHFSFVFLRLWRWVYGLREEEREKEQGKKCPPSKVQFWSLIWVTSQVDPKSKVMSAIMEAGTCWRARVVKLTPWVS